MRFRLDIDLGEIEGLRTGKNLAGILHGLATLLWTATEPLHPAKFGVTNPRFPGKTAGYWEVMPDDDEHIKRALALQSVAPHLSIVEALQMTEKTAEQQGEERTRLGNTPDDTPDDGIPPDPENMNEQRAAAGEAALAYFTEKHGEKAGGEEQNLTDLLADLAHYCDRNDLNLAVIWEKAASHYAEETDNQGTQMDTIPTS